MRIRCPDYTGDTPSGIVERDVPDAPIQKFLNWLLTANRFTYENNPDLNVEKLSKLRAELTSLARQESAVPSDEESSGSAELTVKGLLALCDCETVDELVDVVANAHQLVVASTAVVSDAELGG